MVTPVMTGWMQRPFVALGMLAIAMAMIPLNDALIKLMSAYMPLAEIALIRGVLSMIVLAVFTGGVGSMLALPARVFWSFYGRGMCLVLAMILYFVPLGSLPLPTVITIFFVSPLLITLLSVPFLGERIGVHRMLSVCMGLIGVLVIIRPGTARAASDNSTLDFLFRSPVMPGMQDAGFFVICTAVLLFLSMASSNAYRSVEASMIAPFEYTAIPFAVIWAIVIWDDWPDGLSWLGMGLILCGGLYTVWRERAREVEVMTSTPMPASASAAQAAEGEPDSEPRS